jgi:hypothetical protein
MSFDRPRFAMKRGLLPLWALRPMKTRAIFFWAAILVGVWAKEEADDLVLVEGGTFKNTKSDYYANQDRVRRGRESLP